MSSPKSLFPLKFSLVGPGRVGTSLAHWMVAGGAEPITIAGRSRDRVAGLAAKLGARAVEVDRVQTDGQDLLLLTVSDPALPALATSLAARPQAAVALHTAGALDASVLEPLREAGSSTGTLHPLIAFPKQLEDPRAAEGSVFAIDGEAAAEDFARRLVASWKGLPVRVPPPARLVYHLAASLAAGGVLTLLAAASEMATRVGLPRDIEQGYLSLAAGAIDGARDSHDIPSAITGPVARGDLETFQRQIEVLQGLDENLVNAVTEVANLTLRFTSPQAAAEAPPPGSDS